MLNDIFNTLIGNHKIKLIMETVIITTEGKLEDVIYNVMKKIEKERKETELPVTLSINQVAKKLNKAHLTISRMVQKGKLKSTPDGKIPISELDKFFEI